MATKEVVEIDVKVQNGSAPNVLAKDIRGAKKATEELTDAQKQFNEEQKKTEQKQREVKKGFNDFKQAGGAAISGLDTLTGGLASSFLGVVESIKAATVGLKGMQAAAAASGIFTLMVLLPAIVEQISNLIVTEEEEAEAAKKNAEAKKAQKDELIKLAEAYDKVAKAQEGGVNQLQRELQLLQASGATPEEIYNKKKALLAAERGDLIANREFLFDNAEKVREFNEKLAQNETDLKIAGLERDKAIEASRKARADKARQDREKAAQEEWDKNNRRQQDEEERLATNAKLKADQEQKLRDDKRNTQILFDEIDQMFLEDQAEEVAVKERNAERLKQIEKNKTDFELAEIKKRKQANLDAANAVFDMTLNGLDALISLNKAFTKDDEASKKKAFETDKKLKIAGVVISTSQAVMNQLATLPPPASYIAAGIVATKGIAEIQNIRKTQYDGAGAASPSSGQITAAPAATSPQFNIVGQSGINQLAESVAGRQNQPVQVYVTSGQVTSAASLERRRIRNATFG
jgi:hypothetical protein